MAKKEYQVSVFIGRFQPFHYGHLDTIERAMEMSEHVVVLVGSAHRPRSAKNPFLYEEREAMILSACAKLSERYNSYLTCLPLADTIYDDDIWAQYVEEAVVFAIKQNRANQDNHANDDLRITLIGYQKDHSTYYLKLFPKWGYTPVPPYYKKGNILNATDLRQILFDETNQLNGRIMDYCPAEVVKEIDQVFQFKSVANQSQSNLLRMVEEYQYNQNLKASLQHARQSFEGLVDPNVQRVDAVILSEGYVFIMRRLDVPGKDLCQLPGGYVGPDESHEEAIFRNLSGRFTSYSSQAAPLIAPDFWQSSLKSSKKFEHMDRSEQGENCTHVFVFEIEKGSYIRENVDLTTDLNDRWIAMKDISPSRFFADHFDILFDLFDDVKLDYKAMLDRTISDR